MNHHYVPQFYLRRWADAQGRLLRYQREPNGEIEWASVVPKRTAFEPDLYGVSTATSWEPSYDENTLETDFFSRVDSDAALVLTKLLRGAMKLEGHERKAWALFLNSMLHRHGEDVIDRDRRAPALAAEVMAEFLTRPGTRKDRHRMRRALDAINIDQASRNAHRTLMVQYIRDQQAVEHIANLAWAVVSFKEQNPLVTTDRPVLVNLGQVRPSIEILTMPLSPTRLFLAYPRAWLRPDGTYVDGADEVLQTISHAHDLFLLRQQSCRYVYASRELGDVVRGRFVMRVKEAVDRSLVAWRPRAANPRPRMPRGSRS